MRERLTAAFVAITLLLLLGAGVVRTYAIQQQLRAHENEYVAWEATTIARVLERDRVAGESPDMKLLQSVLEPDIEIRYQVAGGDVVTLTGADFDTSDPDPVYAIVSVGPGSLRISRASDDQVDALGSDNAASFVGLFALLALIAGVVGYFVARALSAPFRKLALAAAALGRGRFDLDLPRTRIPEAREIGSALETAAAQLKDRLEREREFGLHASHVLRTPLTTLGFHLEELVGDPALSPEAREAAEGGLKAVVQLNRAAGELVDISGRGVLVEGAAQPLRDIATGVAQRWADVLDADGGRRLTAAVEGDLELIFTPGPIEQVLDVILTEVVLPDVGAVRVVFEGAASSLRIDVTCAEPGEAPHAPRQPVSAAVEVTLAALGGRIEVPRDRDVIRVHLPRR